MTRIHSIATAVGLAGGALVASVLTAVAPAIALTQEEVARKLNNVPVFTLFNPELKKFAVASLEVDGKSISLVPSYVDRTDAERLLQEQRSANTAIAKGVEVRTIPLSLVFLESEKSKNKPDQPAFQVVPDEDEIKIALQMQAAEGKKDQNWRGIPLFYAPNLGITLKGADGKPQPILPMYFSRADLETYVAEAKKGDAALAKTQIPIKVTTLDRVLQTLLTNNDPAMNQVEFIPPRASLEYVLQSQRQNANPQNANPQNAKPQNAKPANQPAAPAQKKQAPNPAPKK